MSAQLGEVLCDYGGSARLVEVGCDFRVSVKFWAFLSDWRLGSILGCMRAGWLGGGGVTMGGVTAICAATWPHVSGLDPSLDTMSRW